MTTLKTDTAAYDWYADRYQAIVVSRNRWLVTAIVALTLASFQVLALLCLIPLKTSVPFLIKEETTGAVTVLRPLGGDASVTYGESVRKYFLAKYIIARESYDPMDVTINYRTVELMSDKGERNVFDQSIQQSNKHSPIAIYGQHTKRFVRIRSISFLSDRIAQVRLTATERTGPSTETSNDWVAIVTFQFGPAPVLDAERLINPLGFLVTSYRLDQEVVP